jgi:hypothetical protein
MKILKIFTIILTCLLNLTAQGQVLFERTYGWTTFNEARSVKQLADHGYIIAGHTSGAGNTPVDIYLIRTDSMGIVQWQKTFGGQNVDRCNSICISSDSGYVLAGFSNSFNSTGDYNVFLVKTDKTGILQWSREYGGTDWDFGNSILQTPDLGFIIAGSSYNNQNNSSDGLIIKLDSSGTLQWQKTAGTFNDDFYFDNCLTNDGGYIATGYSENGFGGSTDLFVSKFNQFGDSVWTKLFGNEFDEESMGIFSKNGFYTIVGSNDDTASNLNNLIFRTNNNGDSLSTLLLTPPGDEITTDIDTIGNDYWITGYTNSYGGGAKDIFISRIDSMGNVIYGNTFGNIRDEIAYSICTTADRGVIVAGFTTTFTPGYQAVFVVKTDSALSISPVVINVPDVINENCEITIYPDPATSYVNISLENIQDVTDILLY